MHRSSRPVLRRLAGLVAGISLIAAAPARADEIEPNYLAGYRMGFFMAVAAGNSGTKVCGNVHPVALSHAVKAFFEAHGSKAALSYDKVLDLLSRAYPCAAPAAEAGAAAK